MLMWILQFHIKLERMTLMSDDCNIGNRMAHKNLILALIENT